MGQITTTAAIAATPEAVWDVISAPHTYEQWMTIHTKWKGDVPERFSEGATAAEVVTMLGMPNTITWTVDAYEEASRMAISGTGMAGVNVAFEFAVAAHADGGSTASFAADFEGQMIVGALGKAVEQDGLKQLEASLAKLAALLS